MNILVNGIGNIGQTLLGVLYDHKDLLGIKRICALKNTQINDWNRQEIELLIDKGIIIYTKETSEYELLDEHIDQIDYIFDCNANSFGLKNKLWYDKLSKLKGCCAQGSEKGFGTPFMSSINHHQIKDDRYVQVVSCNTHALSSLITTLSGQDLANFEEGDFVIVRRSEDIGNHERLVGSNVISRHLNQIIGTHHAIDVKDLFDTKHINLNIQSSDITTPSQLMHTVRFNLKLKKLPDQNSINESIEANPFVSSTSKFDSNIVFELGRRYSAYGRLFSHAIINSNNLLIDEQDQRIKGWAFIPQEGNTILSTIHAFLIQTQNLDHQSILDKLTLELIHPKW
jgi:glyceraldehyde-3-phosphate dehydrogenase (NAD(P))